MTASNQAAEDGTRGHTMFSQRTGADSQPHQQRFTASEEHYRLLLDSIDEGFCILEVLFDEHERPLDYRYLEVNSAFEQHTGLPDVIGKTVRELIPGFEGDWFQIYGNVALTGEPVRFEEYADAMNRWFSLYAFRTGRPEDRQVAVLFTDITERKLAGAALSAELEAMTTLHQLSAHLVGTSDLATLLEEVLDAAMKIDDAAFGTVQLYEPSDRSLRMAAYRGFTAEFVEQFAVVHEDTPSPCGLALQSQERLIIEDIGTDLRTNQHREAAEAAGYRATHSTPLMGRSGAMVGMLTTHFREPHCPTTRSLRLMDLYARHAADMISAKLAEDALRKSAQFKDELLGLISHEFRNPLTSVVGLIGVLDREYERLDDSTRRDVVRDLVRDSSRLNTLIENMLLLAQAESIESAREPVLLQHILPAFVRRERARAPSRTLHLELPDDVPVVLGHEGYTEQVLENLISNALKYGHGDGTIDIAVEVDESVVSVAVRNQGDILSEEEVARFSEPFFRSASNSALQGGIGLGMSVCVRLVHALGGTLTATPRSGGGLDVGFTLQRADDVEE